MRTAEGRVAPLETPRRARGIAASWTVLLLALAAAWVVPTSAAATTALLVVGSTTLNASDAALRQRLERHYAVTIRDDDATADLGKDVVVLSGSVAASTLGSKYKTTSQGVVVLAPAVLPAMAMASAFGTVANQTQIKIVYGTSTLAAGFATNTLVQVYPGGRSMGWATPAPAARKVAVLASGASNQVTVFRHLRGTSMIGGYIAAGRRVGYYLPVANALTESGWRLLDNAIAYAVGLAALWPPSPGSEVWPSPSWTVAAPGEVGMDPARTAQALRYGSSRGGSGIVVRHGRRVGYWGNQAARYDLRSTTKSFGSILLGFAIGDSRGRFGLDTLVQPLLPALGVPQRSPAARKWLSTITVRNLATHTAGFAKPGGFEQLQFAPGTGWLYSDGGPNWLADLLTTRYRQDLNEVLRSRLLAPMGIRASELVWRRNRYRPPTLTIGGVPIERREFGSGISTSVDVMAKFGLMLLRGGRWQSTRLIDPGYVATAVSHQSGLSGLPCYGQICGEPLPTENYGLLFWTNADGRRPNTPRNAYETAGQYTSFILVIPSLDLVVARAGPASAAWVNPPGTDAKSTFYALVAGAVDGAPTTARRAPEVLRGSIEEPDL